MPVFATRRRAAAFSTLSVADVVYASIAGSLAAMVAVRKAVTPKRLAFGIAVGMLAAASVEPAMAQSTDVFSNIQTKANTAFQDVRTIAFIIAGFGIIAISVMAYFGRFNFKHLAGLVGGLVLISAAAGFISYVTGGNTSGNSAISYDSSQMGDTFAK